MAATHRKRIGVRVNDYRREVRAGLSLAARQGFTAVELAVDGGALAPENLSASGRRHVARLVQNTGMAFTAVACELPGGGLADPRTIDASVARVQRVLHWLPIWMCGWSVALLATWRWAKTPLRRWSR
jgi:predicted deacylase